MDGKNYKKCSFGHFLDLLVFRTEDSVRITLTVLL